MGKSNAPDYNESNVKLSGATLGLQVLFKNILVNASYSKALAIPGFLTQNQSVFLFDARIQF